MKSFARSLLGTRSSSRSSSRGEDSVFQGTGSTMSRRRALAEHLPPQDDAEIEEPVVEDHARDDVEDDGGDNVGDDAGDDAGGDSGAGGDSAAGSGTSRVKRTRNLHFVGPPPELPPESRVLIKPSGKTWIDDSFTGIGHYRQVNMVLGNLVRLHWPGLVTLPTGESVPATTWEHYRYGVCRTFGNTQALVWDAFWKRYKLPDDGSYDMNARYVFEYNANDVVADAMYYA